MYNRRFTYGTAGRLADCQVAPSRRCESYVIAQRALLDNRAVYSSTGAVIIVVVCAWASAAAFTASCEFDIVGSGGAAANTQRRDDDADQLGTRHGRWQTRVLSSCAFTASLQACELVYGADAASGISTTMVTEADCSSDDRRRRRRLFGGYP